MPKILFLTIHRPDRNPSQRFRFEQYLDYLEGNNFKYKFSYLLNAKNDKIFYSEGKYLSKLFIILKGFLKRCLEVFSASKYDIIFVQRECFMLGTSFFEKMFARKAPLIFDFDDSIWLQNVSDANKMFGWLKNANKTPKIISYSNLVLAGNPYLARYARKINQNVLAIPTTIDTTIYSKLPQEEFKNQIIIGWSGSITTIKHFNFALNFLKQIKDKYGSKVSFIVVGDGNYINSDLGITGIPWIKEDEIKELSRFDIGIMPLPNDEWANGKCGLKGLQYMSLSIPTIMSPVGVNIEIIQDGVNGFLADSDEEWIDKLSRLIESKELREKLGSAGRQTVVEKYSVEANKQKYLDAFNSLLKN